jgi:hypothetical protein
VLDLEGVLMILGRILMEVAFARQRKERRQWQEKQGEQRPRRWWG